MNQEQLALQERIAAIRASLLDGRVVAPEIATLQNDLQSIEEMARGKPDRGTASTATEGSLHLGHTNAREVAAAKLDDLTGTGAVVLQRGLQVLGRGASVLGAVQLGSELISPAIAGEVCAGGVNCYSRDPKYGQSTNLEIIGSEPQEVTDGR